MAANKVFWWDAPKGYKAVKYLGDDKHPCTSCCFYIPNNCDDGGYEMVSCRSFFRKDKQEVIFIKREHHVQ